MTTPPVVFVLLDAFRWDYVNPVDTPFLHGLSESGLFVQRLVSSSGFAQRTTIFCGTFPDRTGNFAMFAFDPGRSPFSFLTPYGSILAFIQTLVDLKLRGSGRLSDALRRRHIEPRARTRAAYAPSAYIPLHVLQFIGIAEDEKPIHLPGALPAESVFDVLSRQGVDYAYLMFPTVNCDDDGTLARVLEGIRERRRLYCVQFSDADFFCHLDGPESAVRHRVAGEIDRKLRVLQQAFHDAGDSPTFFIVGDHGMMEVEETVDVAAIVHGRAKRRGLRHGTDYLLFLDSTLARLWALRARAEGQLDEIIDDPVLQRAGTRITTTLAREYRIPWPDRRYGDVMWWARPGVLVHPDYFHPAHQVVRGMHGYDSRHEKMQGFAVLHGGGIRPNWMATASLVDVCSTLCGVLGVPVPTQNEGRSLLAASPTGPGSTGAR